MKKLFSTDYSSAAFNFSMLILRVNTGLWLIAKHGLVKLQDFSTIQQRFYNFMGLGSNISLILVIFAELFCSSLVVLGLFTRVAVIPIIFMLIIAAFGAKGAQPLFNKEVDFLFLMPFIVLLFCGPGRISVDAVINR
jgi:putative oxidoreductase